MVIHHKMEYYIFFFIEVGEKCHQYS